jgi:hypothetical protein
MINAGSNYRQIIPSMHLRRFYEEGKPPPGVAIDVGLSTPQTDPTLEWRQSQDFLILCPSGSTLWQTDRWRSYKVTLAIDRLLVKVMFWPNLACTLPIDRDDKAFRIWPYSSDVAFDKGSNDEGIDAFDVGVVVYPD